MSSEARYARSTYSVCVGHSTFLPLTLLLTTHNRFTSSKTFLDSIDLRRDLSTCCQIPAHFWTDICQEASGFFGCQDILDKKLQVKGYSMFVPTPQASLSDRAVRHMVPILDQANKTR